MERWLGAHLSISGGHYKAVQAAEDLGMTALQVFTKSNHQWKAKELTEREVERYHGLHDQSHVGPVIAHDSYLINLASPDDELWQKSIDALVIELRRCHRLGIADLVAHPGAHTHSTEEEGLSRVAAGLDRVFDATADLDVRVALETTAGQGTNLGWRFEHLASIIEQCGTPQRLSLCVDTCHLLAAGYPLVPKTKYSKTMKELDRVVGLDRLACFHLNDSKRELGSRVDRHEHIGQGYVGAEAFGFILKDRRFRRTPMILETPKGTDEETGREWDAINLEKLCELGGIAALR